MQKIIIKIMGLFIFIFLTVGNNNVVAAQHHLERARKANKEITYNEKFEKDAIRKEVLTSIDYKHKIKKMFYRDYDGDGRKEAFVLSAGQKYKHPVEEYGTLWFGYYSDDKVHVKKLRKDITFNSDVLKLKSGSLFRAEIYCDFVYSPTLLYKVQGNNVKKIFAGDSIRKDKGDSFTTFDRELDAMYEEGMEGTIGRTFKPYYFYYKNGKIYEYKAWKISLNKFKQYKNSSKFLKKIKKDNGNITDIFYRSNNMIHINYKKPYQAKEEAYGGENLSITLKVKDNKVTFVSTYNGIYSSEHQTNFPKLLE